MRTHSILRRFLFGSSVACLLAAGLAVSGCESDSNNNGGSGGGGTVTVETWTAKQTAGFCTYLARCGETVGLHLASQSSCATTLAPEFLESDEVAKVAKGTMKFNADKAASCLASVQTADCAALRSEEGPAGCDEVFSGTVANGSACSSDDECENGRCDYDDTKQCLVCKPFIALGEACEMGWGCVKGATCSEGKCVAKGSVAIGKSCSGSQDCASGAFCAWGDRGGGVCTAKAAKDGACDDSEGCQAGLVCSEAQGGQGGGTCQARKAEGEACSQPDQPFEGTSECVSGVCGLVSPSAPPKCLPWKKMGESCESHWQCGLVDAYCNAGKCAPLPGSGAACADLGFAKLCGFGLGCDDANKCVNPPATGPCINGDCADGSECVCMDNQCDTRECKPDGKLGDACGEQGQASCGQDLQCDFQTGKCAGVAACK